MSPGKDLSMWLKCLVIMDTHTYTHTHALALDTVCCVGVVVGVGVLRLASCGASCKPDKPIVASAVNLVQ